MPVTADRPGPYAPSTAILSLIERHRSRGLPSPVDADVLARAGISDSLRARTLQAMQVLDLVDESGHPTATLESLRLAPESEYKGRLKAWLDEAYHDALQYVDPATDDETKVRDAFRSYKPIGQQDRMVTLFMGLYTAAGVIDEKPKNAPRRASAPAQRLKVQRPSGRGQAPQKTQPSQPSAPVPAPSVSGAMPPPLAGLLATLPSPAEGWTQSQRDAFVQLFGAVLDFCFPIRNGTQKMDESEDTA